MRALVAYESMYGMGRGHGLAAAFDTLLDGEATRARCWGGALGAAASRLYHPAHA